MANANDVVINGETFKTYGYGDHDGNLHMILRLTGETPEDVINAIKNGGGTFKIYDSEGSLIKQYNNYGTLLKYTLSYRYLFDKFDKGDAMMIVVGRSMVDSDDVTDLQMAVAELATLIGGNKNE